MADDAALSDDGTPPAKRKKVSTSSRGVANLTPEQLARKRANDREAQRAIRERTRNQMDTLNARIQELESAQPYHDLQSALRQRDAALAENEDIKRRLATVIGILQPLVGGNIGLNELAAAAERIPVQEQNENGSYATALLATGGQEQQVEGSPAHASVNGRSWQSGDTPGTGMRAWASGSSQWEPARDNLDPSLQYSHSDERLGVDFLLDNSQRQALQNGVAAAQSQASLSPEIHPHSTPTDRTLEGWQTLPNFIPSTCPLDTIFLGFLAECSRLAQTGVTSETLAGPKYPNFDPIIDSEGFHRSHEVSKVLTDILPTFPDISRTPEQVGVVYIMFLVLRWLVNPNQENYELMPEWVQPRPSQLFTAYPIWATYIPWPRLRDRVVSNQPAPPFDHFFVPYTKTLSLNWPYAAQDCLIRNPAYSPGTLSAATQPSADPLAYPSQWMMNPAFETHIRDLSNWSLGPSFVETFPGYGDAVKIKELNQ